MSYGGNFGRPNIATTVMLSWLIFTHSKEASNSFDGGGGRGMAVIEQKSEQFNYSNL